METENPYRPPEAQIRPSPDELFGSAEEPPLASRWARLGGAMLDGLIILGIFLPFMWMTGYFERVQASAQSFGESLLLTVLGMGVFLAVNGYLLAHSGQTVGKRLVGTRIVSVDTNEILPLGHIFLLRYVVLQAVSVIPVLAQVVGLGNALFIFRRDRRCIHDLIAGTKVIRAA